LNYFVSCTCTDYFTNTIEASYVCLSGGNLIINNTYCSAQTAPIDKTTNTCPNDYTKKDKKCVKDAYHIHLLFVQTDIGKRKQTIKQQSQ